MLQRFQFFYYRFLCGIYLSIAIISTVQALPDAGNWQTSQGDQFQITAAVIDGEDIRTISDLTLTINPGFTGASNFQVRFDNILVTGNDVEMEGYPVAGVLSSTIDGQTGTHCGMPSVPDARCHLRIKATFTATTATFSLPAPATLEEEMRGEYSWISNNGNREDGSQITGNNITATHDINGGPVLSFQGLTNNTLPFGNQIVNTTSAAKPVTVSNTGTANATGITVAFTGNYARPSGTSGGTCGTTLNVGASCTIGITFTPTAAGAGNGTVTVNSNAPVVTATLTGTGIPVTVLSASPTSLSFRDQIINTTSTAQFVTIKNNSTTAAVTGIDLTINGGVHYSRPSGTAGGTCPSSTATNFSLPANDSCTIYIAFKPTVVGNNLTDKLVITSAANDIDVPLTGNGIPIPPVVLSLSPTSLNFGNQTVNTTSAVKTVTLTKTGAAATNLTVNATGSYAISGGTCSNTLNAASCTIGITFRPTATGTINGTLTASGTGANTVNATLTGTGTPPPPPPPAGVTSVPVFGLPGLWILTMLLTSLVGMVGFRKQS